MKNKLGLLWELYITLFKIGICTFGGGIAMLPILERELVDRKNWTSSEELLDWFAIGQSTPGIIAVNVATFIGNKLAGVIGGIVGTLGMVSPSLIIITIIAKFISNFSSLTWVQCALIGINVSVAALLTNAVWKLVKKSVKNVLGVILFLSAFISIYFFKVDTVWVIIFSSYVGVLIGAFKGDYKKTGVIIFGILLVISFVGVRYLKYEKNSISENNTEIVNTEVINSSDLPENNVLNHYSSETSKVSLFFLFCIFFYIGLITIGGGIVAITIMQQLLVEKYDLLSTELFYNMVAISESTPGPLGINMATYLGTELYGVGGGLITTLGQVMPSIICILLITKFFAKFSDRAGVKAGFSTLRPAVTGVIAVAAIKIFVLAILNVPESLSSFASVQTWKNLINIPHMIFYILGFTVLSKTKVHPLFIVLAGGIFGVLIH